MQFNQLINLAIEELSFKTNAHAAMWGLGTEVSWLYDQDRRVLNWVFDSGHKAVASGEIVGTYNDTDETWLWGWANSSVPESGQGSGNIARVYGLEHDFDRLIIPRFNCNLDEAWELAAITMHLEKKQGIYKIKENSVHVFFCFDSVQLNH